MNQKYIKHLQDIVHFYIQQKDQWKAKAYQKAALILQEQNLSFVNGKLQNKIAGIGASIQTTLEEFESTGTSSKYQSFIQLGLPPPEIQQLQRIPQVGAQTAKRIWEKFKISSLEEFEKRMPELQESEFAKYVPLFLEIKNSLERLPRHIVKKTIDALLNPLVDIDWSYAGSMRRGKELVRDVDVIVCLRNETDKEILKTHFDNYGLVCDVRDGEAKWGLSIPIEDQMITLDLNFCLPNQLGGYKNYLTGSKEHNIALRAMAKDLGYLVNQKGVFDSQSNQVDDYTEEFLFDLLKIPYIPPPCRELGAVGRDFSNLITEEDILCDFHIHTSDSDGFYSLEEMVELAQQEGFSMIGISDHSQGSGSGPKENERLQILEDFRTKNFNLPVYYGAEIDVKVSGELDYSLDLLERLDYYIIAAHHGQSNLTERYTKAMEQCPQKAKIIAHPLNRKIGIKVEGEVDWPTLFERCKANNTVLEINCQPDRLDLSDRIIKMAQEAGVYLILGSDSHGSSLRELFRHGVLMAQRGWLMKDMCLNYRKDLIKKWLKGELYN